MTTSDRPFVKSFARTQRSGETRATQDPPAASQQESTPASHRVDTAQPAREIPSTTGLKLDAKAAKSVQVWLEPEQQQLRRIDIPAEMNSELAAETNAPVTEPPAPAVSSAKSPTTATHAATISAKHLSPTPIGIESEPRHPAPPAPVPTVPSQPVGNSFGQQATSQYESGGNVLGDSTWQSQIVTYGNIGVPERRENVEPAHGLPQAAQLPPAQTLPAQVATPKVPAKPIPAPPAAIHAPTTSPAKSAPHAEPLRPEHTIPIAREHSDGPIATPRHPISGTAVDTDPVLRHADNRKPLEAIWTNEPAQVHPPVQGLPPLDVPTSGTIRIQSPAPSGGTVPGEKSAAVAQPVARPAARWQRSSDLENRPVDLRFDAPHGVVASSPSARVGTVSPSSPDETAEKSAIAPTIDVVSTDAADGSAPHVTPESGMADSGAESEPENATAEALAPALTEPEETTVARVTKADEQDRDLAEQPETSARDLEQSLARNVWPGAQWEVDVFEVPESVANLFFDDGFFHSIATRLNETVANGLHSIAITSVRESEGRSTVAIGSAIAAAASGLRVALIDIDVHGPTLADDLRLELDGGWGDAIRNGLPLDRIAVSSLEDGVTFFPLMSYSELVSPLEIVSLMESIDGIFDLVVIDAPLGTDTILSTVCKQVDSAFITRDVRFTSQKEVNVLADRLRRFGVRGIGVVENFVG